jgi:hypothetical protein
VKRLLLIIAAALACHSPASAADSLLPGDFARMIPLTLAGSGALYELPLPTEVYTGVQRAGLGDLAVFNGAGEIVPFTLLQSQPTETIVKGRQLPLFPLPGGSRQQQGSLHMQVRTDEHGAIVNLTAAPHGTTSAGVATYIVDASGLESRVSGLDFALQPGDKEYIGSVRVETSDDLQHWREHASGALAILTAGSQQLNRSGIEFPAVTARYFRLLLCEAPGLPGIAAVTARLESSPELPVRATARYFITPVKGQPGDFLLRTGGSMPVDRVRLHFDDLNSLAGATFFSRTDDKSPWVERGSGTFYRLGRDSAVVDSTALEIAPTADREWLIRIRQPGSSPGRKLPMVEIGWLPQKLVFAARGEPPFRLAFGSARSGSDSLRDDSVSAGLASWAKQQIRPLPALAGASVESGGKKALRPAIPATTWRRLLLWGALLGGVLVLARMAWQLAREMGCGPGQKNAPESENPLKEKEEGDGP